jgi:hypothetical protein
LLLKYKRKNKLAREARPALRDRGQGAWEEINNQCLIGSKNFIDPQHSQARVQRLNCIGTFAVSRRLMDQLLVTTIRLACAQHLAKNSTPKKNLTFHLLFKKFFEIIMPNDLIHRIGIAAPAEKIYRAISAKEGIQGWWTSG